MKKLIFTLAILMPLSTLYSQENSEIEGFWENKKTYFTADIFSSMNPFLPRYRAGIISDLGPDWKLGLDLGYGDRGICYTYLLEHFNDYYRLWEIRPEVYRLIYSTEEVERYISLAVFYIHHTDQYSSTFYYPSEGGEISYSHASFRRQKFGFNINLGLYRYLRRGFGMNVFIGGGLRLRNSTFSDIQNPRSTESFVDMFDFNEYREKEGLDFGPNVSLGFRFLF